MKTFYWLLKREYWENRGQVLRTPLITGAVFVLINIMGIIAGEVITGRKNIHIGTFDLPDASSVDPDVLNKVGMAMDASMYMIASTMLTITAIVMFFYCLGALFDDRKDRSILLWKSLPISDRDTVLSKLTTALVVAPVISALAGILTAWAILLIFAITASMHGVGVFELLWTGHPFRVATTLLLSVPVYVLWALPTAGWLLLCSAWAKGRPFLWAILLPVGAGAVISWLSLMGLFNGFSVWFWKHIVARVLLGLFPGGWLPDSIHSQLQNGHVRIHGPDQLVSMIGLQSNYAMLATPQLWVGAAAGAAMIVGAIWLRRWRTEV
jgi:ABC-2 type transport system permease protein